MSGYWRLHTIIMAASLSWQFVETISQCLRINQLSHPVVVSAVEVGYITQ